MITVRNEFETIPAFESIAGDTFGTSTPREVTIEMLENLEKVTSCIDLIPYYKTLAALSDESTDEMEEMQEELAGHFNDEAPLAPYCLVELQEGEWRVVPQIDDEVPRVDECPDEYMEDYVYVVNDHGNVTLMGWEHSKNEYQSIWSMV